MLMCYIMCCAKKIYYHYMRLRICTCVICNILYVPKKYVHDLCFLYYRYCQLIILVSVRAISLIPANDTTGQCWWSSPQEYDINIHNTIRKTVVKRKQSTNPAENLISYSLSCGNGNIVILIGKADRGNTTAPIHCYSKTRIVLITAKPPRMTYLIYSETCL